ncbi:MAG: hypothetical protein AAGK74_17560, partial [Chloroflexota bacterium]
MKKRELHEIQRRRAIHVVVSGLLLAASLEGFLQYLKLIRYDAGSVDYSAYLNYLPYVAIALSILLFARAIRTVSISAVVTTAFVVAFIIGSGSLINQELTIQSPDVVQLRDGRYLKLEKVYAINAAGNSAPYTAWLIRCDSFHLRLSNCEVIWFDTTDNSRWHLRDDIYLTHDPATDRVEVIA